MRRAGGGKIKKLGFIALLVSSLLACDLGASVDTKTKTIMASDKQSQVEVPADWNALDLNEKAELQVGNRRKEVYLIVLTENKRDLVNMNLEKHSQLTLEKLVKNTLTSSRSAGSVIRVNGLRALQYKVEATFTNVNVIYLHTDIEGKSNYHQVIAWTLRSKFSEEEAVLRQVIDSFKELAK